MGSASRSPPSVSLGSHRSLAELAPFALAQAAPDAETLVVLQRVVEALGLDLARGADALGVTGRAALLRKEGLGVGLSAELVGLPRERVLLGLVGPGLSHSGDTELDRIDEPVVRNAWAIL